MSFGDNDRLAALVTNLIRAPLLVLLSDIDGLYAGDPADPNAKVISVLTDAAQAGVVMVHERAGEGLQLSRGGMASKLKSARIVTSAGENVVIANGRTNGVLDQIIAGEDVGTLLLAEGKAVDSRRRWIGWSAQPAGKLLLDEGARRAITAAGRSLLAIGVKHVEGNFAKGDVVALCDEAGKEFARGLINYPSSEMQKIAGRQTQQIAELLGHRPDEVVHRDNLLVLG
jgi:glutamate 5-kinase